MTDAAPPPVTSGRLLVVTAVAAERDAVAAGLDGCAPAPAPATVIAGGVGPAAAAAATATALARGGYGLVISAGIGGGFAPAAPIGSVVVATTMVAADLGAQTPETAEGFTPVAELGFGTSAHRTPPELAQAVAAALEAVHGPVLTVSTVTGTAERAAELSRRHPGAAAEAMEGFGVAEAAAAAGVPVLEIRAVSNTVGPRDRSAWQIGTALAALTTAFGRLPAALEHFEGIEGIEGIGDSRDIGDRETLREAPARNGG